VLSSDLVCVHYVEEGKISTDIKMFIMRAEFRPSHASGEWNFLIVTDGNFINWYKL
jgi:hypothetical protein